MEADLVDLMTSRSERNKGIQKVSLNNDDFMTRALAYIRWRGLVPLHSKEEFTGEQIRQWMQFEYIVPAHPNAWGALISTAVKRKLIVPTGSYTQMRSKTSHARKTAVYRWA